MSQRVEDLVSINYDVRMLGHGWEETVTTPNGERKFKHPGLVHQLRNVIVGVSPSDDGGNASGKPVSAPMPGSEGPLSLVVEIEVEVARLVKLLGASAASKKVEDNLAFVEAASATAENFEVAEVAKTLAGLTNRASVELSWAEAPRRLRAKCPHCQVFGSLVVSMDVGGLRGAHCDKCEARWGRADIGHLGALLQGEGA